MVDAVGNGSHTHVENGGQRYEFLSDGAANVGRHGSRREVVFGRLAHPFSQPFGFGDLDDWGVAAGQFVVAEDDFRNSVAKGRVGFVAFPLRFTGAVKEDYEGPFFLGILGVAWRKADEEVVAERCGREGLSGEEEGDVVRFGVLMAGIFDLQKGIGQRG